MVIQTAGYAGTAAHGGVPLDRPSGETEAEDLLTGPPLTKGYKPSIPAAMFISTRGQAYMPSMLADVEMMLLHPCVVAPYQYYRSAIASVKFKIKASSSKVGSFVLGELQKFWSRCLYSVQDAYDYGWIAAELSYQYDKGLLGLYSLETFHPLDCWALTVDDSYVGASIQNISGAAGRQSLWGPGKYPAKGFWFAHDKRWDRYYGRSQLYAAWRPWRRLGYRDGAEEVVDGGVYRFAYRGPIMRYPVRSFTKADGGIDFDGARNKAREFVENAKAGASVALPNTRDDKGNFDWEIDWPDHTIDVSSLVGYIEYLKKEVSLGVGVPPELLEASDTGSGWSGRKVPMLGFYQGQRKNANAILTAWKWQVGDPLVAWNFGPEAWFEVGVELVLPGGMSEEGDQPPSQPGSPPPPSGGGGENPLAGLMGGGGGEMSTLGGDPVNSLQAYALQSYNRTAQARRKRVREKYELGIELAADNGPPPGYKPAPRAKGKYRKEVSPGVFRYWEPGGGERDATPEEASEHRTPRSKVRGARKKAALAEARKPAIASRASGETGEKPGPGLEGMVAPTPSVFDTGEKARAGTLKPHGLPSSAPQDGGQKARKAKKAKKAKKVKKESWMARAWKMVGKVLAMSREGAGKGKKALQKYAENRKKEAQDNFKLNYRGWKKLSPEVAAYIGPIIDLGNAAWDATPLSFINRMRNETRQQNKVARAEAGQARVDQARRDAEARGEELSPEQEKKVRERKSATVIGVIEYVMDAVGEAFNTALGSAGLAGSLVAGTFGAGLAVPAMSGLYILASGVLNPWGTMQAAWNTVRHDTQQDREKANLRKQQLNDASRFADLPEDDPEVEQTRLEHMAASNKRQRFGKEKKNQNLGFTLAVEGEEEGKLYPGLRHRIREVFATAKDPDWAEALFFACLDLHRDDPAAAIAAVEEALERQPKQPPGTPEFDPAKWFGKGGESQDEGDDNEGGEEEPAEPDVDADEDSAETDAAEGDPAEPEKEDEEDEDGTGTDLGTLAADSLWVLTRPTRVSQEELTGLQDRLRRASPEERAEVNRRLSAVLESQRSTGGR